MNEQNEPTTECHRSGKGWGVFGIAALVGIAAAAAFVISQHRRSTGRAFSIDDLIDAADKVAGDLESRLLGERVSA